MKRKITKEYAQKSERLRRIFVDRRNELELSMADLAARLGVPYRSSIGKIELGERRLDVCQYVEYCRALELNPERTLKRAGMY